MWVVRVCARVCVRGCLCMSFIDRYGLMVWWWLKFGLNLEWQLTLCFSVPMCLCVSMSLCPLVCTYAFLYRWSSVVRMWWLRFGWSICEHVYRSAKTQHNHITTCVNISLRAWVRTMDVLYMHSVGVCVSLNTEVNIHGVDISRNEEYDPIHTRTRTHASVYTICIQCSLYEWSPVTFRSHSGKELLICCWSHFFSSLTRDHNFLFSLSLTTTRHWMMSTCLVEWVNSVDCVNWSFVNQTDCRRVTFILK